MPPFISGFWPPEPFWVLSAIEVPLEPFTEPISLDIAFSFANSR